MKQLRNLILALALSAGLAPAFAQVAPPVPALPDTERRTSYSISASTCVCSVGFQLYGDSTDYSNWIEVFVNGVRMTQAGNWTLSSVTGTIGSIPLPITNAVLTFTAPQTGTVQIVGARRPRRTSQFNEGAGIPTRNMNVVISDLTAQNRELWDKTNDVTGRALISQPGNTLSMLPLPSACGGKFLGFDATGLIPQCNAGGAGSGNVVGPVSSTVGHVAFWNNTTGTLLSDGGTVRSIIPSTSYFVDDINGNDANACTSATTGACKTLNGVVARIAAFDLNFQAITVSVAAPAVSYAGMSCTNPWIGIGTVTFTGNTTTPTSVLVAGGANPAFDIENGCSVSLRGFSVSSAGGGGGGSIVALFGGRISMTKMDLASVGTGSQAVYSNRISSYIEITDTVGATTIHTGTLATYFIQASHGGEVRIICTTACMSFTANVTYGQFLLLADHGDIVGTPSASFALNGFTVTGNQWDAISTGSVQWNGLFPPNNADIPGTSGSGVSCFGSGTASGPQNCLIGGPGGVSFNEIIGGANGTLVRNQANNATLLSIDNSGNAALPTGSVAVSIASGAKALATGAISSATCTTAQTATATGTATTDIVTASFNGDPTAVTGYVPLTTGMLTIIAYPTVNTVNFKVCNNTASSITPGAITLNWKVVR